MFEGNSLEPEFMNKCLELLENGLLEIDKFKSKQVRMLKLKILSCLCVFSVKTGDEEYSNNQLNALKECLQEQRDSKMKAYELKSVIKMILEVHSTFNLEEEIGNSSLNDSDDVI